MNRLNCSGLSGLGFGLRGMGSLAKISNLSPHPFFLALFRLFAFPFQKLFFKGVHGFSGVHESGFLSHLNTVCEPSLPRFPISPISKAGKNAADHYQQKHSENDAKSYLDNQYHLLSPAMITSCFGENLRALREFENSWTASWFNGREPDNAQKHSDGDFENEHDSESSP
jgi:hypothetical protein